MGSIAQNSVCEETKPVATESSVPVSSHQDTQKMSVPRSWARACLSPGPLQPRGNRAMTPSKAGYRDDSPEVCVWMDGWGWSQCLWNVRMWPGSTYSCPQLPPGHWHEVTPPWVGASHFVLHIPAQPDLPRKEAQCLALGWAGPGWGCSLHHRSGQLPQEAPRVPM